MSLYTKLQQRQAEGKPIRIGLIGAGKFGSMYLAQVPRTPGVHLVGIADLSPDAAKANLARVGWQAERTQAASLDDAVKRGTTFIGDNWQALVRHPSIDVIVECTGNPVAAVDHCIEAFAQQKHVVNVTVEADAFCGPLLANKAAEAGVIYSLAFGDQPALICDLVDWARTCGFPVTAAGRGHKWLPHFAQSTPDTVWGYYGLTPEQAARGGLNPKMFNSFLDGSKPSIESTAVSNATGLGVPSNGLLYPPASVEDIPFVTRPISEGGVLERKGMVEVISSLEADGLFSAETSTGAGVTIKNVMVNGFEIDTPNSTRIALAPSPADGDEHVDADAGALTLGWSAPTAGNAVSYDVYFGTNRDAVKNATPAAPQFRGNQAALSRSESGLLSHLTYYWRIDAIDGVGNATHGTTWYFRPRHLAFPGARPSAIAWRYISY